MQLQVFLFNQDLTYKSDLAKRVTGIKQRTEKDINTIYIYCFVILKTVFDISWILSRNTNKPFWHHYRSFLAYFGPTKEC